MDPQQNQIMFDQETLKGKYANNMRAAGSGEEIFLDFFQVSPTGEQHVSRIVVSPAHLKRISASLSQFMADYEKEIGAVVKAAKEPDEKAQFGFRIADEKSKDGKTANA